ncbi:CRTAC1 family protein [Candidatus Palauibacter sp.]|uniref:CRTAC1 family protein n=1 Tax=Candidatus Palauibacter sp. TaxID=3101350 RepID=UPI003B01492E
MGRPRFGIVHALGAGVPLLAAGVAFLGACSSGPALPSIDWTEADGVRQRPLSAEGIEGGGFHAVPPGQSGISAATALSLDTRLGNRTLAHGTGIALGDADGDGWVDVYVCLLDGPNVLYRNLGGWRFEDVTEASGTALAGRTSRGGAFADADGDGDLDLFVAVHGGTNVLLVNDGTGTFAEREAGFEGTYGTTTVGLADIDGDDDLDAYFTNYKVIQGDDLFSPAERSMEGKLVEVDGGYEFIPPYNQHYRVERIGDRVRRHELAEPDEMYLNDGSGRFTRVDFTGGMFRTFAGDPLAETPRAWGLVARFFDMDDDGDPDLYVANDFGSLDGIWLNEAGQFRAASGLRIRTTSASSMGVDFSDIDGDGDTDFVTTEMLALDPVRRREQAHPLQDGRAASAIVPRTPPGQSHVRARVGRNTLQLNRGDGTFAEVGRAAGVAASEWTWGAMFLDVDLDGYEDLLITNGHTWDPLDGDTQEDLRTGRIQVDWRRENGAFPLLRLRNLAFRNLGDGTFEEWGEAWRYGEDPDVSHGIAQGDLDRDGDLDIIVTRMNEPPLVLRNDAAAPRVAVRLRAGGANSQAIGARVELLGGALRRQTRQVTAGGMYLSGSDPLLAFAMGASDSAMLRVTWPRRGGSDGTGPSRSAVTEFAVAANTLYEIDEPEGGVPAGDRGAEPSAAATRAVPDDGSTAAPFFEGPILGGRHAESEFDELARQPLIPIEPSRLGPGVSWEDIDRDGDPDLLTASGAGGRAQLVRTDGDRLLAPVPFGAPAPGDQTTILAVPDPGRPADPRLIAGVSNWEATTPAELTSIPRLMRLSAGGQPGIPPAVDAAGPVAAADVDGDGDLDLFLGGRAVAGSYPRPASSRVLRNESGAWVDDAGWSAGLGAIGLVSGALFSDVDGDGDPDLVLALEWGPVRLFLNEGTGFRDATAAWGLAAFSGRWNGVASGDLDGDGRPDLIATAWGSNTGRIATSERPISIRAGDLDGNGLVDVIEADTDRLGVERPRRGFLTLSDKLPFIRRAAPTYEAFARATVDDLLGARRADMYAARATTLAHTVFLNRGNGFETRPLPAGAQLAPAFGVVVADFDRDGAEDLFIAQNFFGAPAGVPRHDAGRGAILLGDGMGGLTPVGAERSGVAVYGDGRGAAVADYDGDGRWDLAVGQNGEETLIFRGDGGMPGLRVRPSGGALNPDAVGAALRVVYEEGEGPLREIQAGSGYWSRNGAVQVFGLRAEPRAVWVRWPDGAEEVFPIDPVERDVVLRPGEGTR